MDMYPGTLTTRFCPAKAANATHPPAAAIQQPCELVRQSSRISACAEVRSKPGRVRMATKYRQEEGAGLLKTWRFEHDGAEVVLSRCKLCHMTDGKMGSRFLSGRRRTELADYPNFTNQSPE